MAPVEASSFVEKHNDSSPIIDQRVGHMPARFDPRPSPVDSLVVTRLHAGQAAPPSASMSLEASCMDELEPAEAVPKSAYMRGSAARQILLPSPMARRMHLQPPRTPTSPSISPMSGPWHGKCGSLEASPSNSSSSASQEFDDHVPCTPRGLFNKLNIANNLGIGGEKLSHSLGEISLQGKVHKEGYPLVRRNTYPTSLSSTLPNEEHVTSLLGSKASLSSSTLSQASPCARSPMAPKEETLREELRRNWERENRMQHTYFDPDERPAEDGQAGCESHHVVARADYGMQLLSEAICAQLPDEVAALLGSGCSPHGENGSSKGTPLIFAAIFGNEKITKLLLAAGANINFYDSKKYTALHHAAIGGHRNVVKLLLVSGANIHARTIENFLAIQLTTDLNIHRLLKLHMGSETLDELGTAQQYQTDPTTQKSPSIESCKSSFVNTNKMPLRDQLVVSIFEDNKKLLQNDQYDVSYVTESCPSNSTVRETISDWESKMDDQVAQRLTGIVGHAQSYGDSKLYDSSKGNVTNLKNLQIPGSQSEKPVQGYTNLKFHTETSEKLEIIPRPAIKSESKSNGSEKKTVKFVAAECTEEDLALVRKDWHDAARAGCCGCGKEGCGGKCLPQRSPKNGKGQLDNLIDSEKVPHSEIKASGSFMWARGELLGEGAYGKVFAGLNQNTGELMAVKQLKMEPSNGQEKGFHLASLEREISLYKKMRHKHIVGYVHMEKDEASGSLYIFLEYVSGGSLQSMLERFGRFSESLVKVYTRQLLLGLEYLHKNKVVHRDIKGGNVLVDAGGVVKLADFGASKAFHDTMMTDGCRSIRGSVFWMAPEVIKGDGYGRRADIWSVGCTMIEMLTATHPWPGIDNTWTAIFHIAKASSGPPIPEHVSECVKDFLHLCFQLDPKKRPTATELLQHEFVSTNLDLTDPEDTSDA